MALVAAELATGSCAIPVAIPRLQRSAASRRAQMVLQCSLPCVMARGLARPPPPSPAGSSFAVQPSAWETAPSLRIAQRGASARAACARQNSAAAPVVTAMLNAQAANAWMAFAVKAPVRDNVKRATFLTLRAPVRQYWEHLMERALPVRAMGPFAPENAT